MARPVVGPFVLALAVGAASAFLIGVSLGFAFGDAWDMVLLAPFVLVGSTLPLLLFGGISLTRGMRRGWRFGFAFR